MSMRSLLVRSLAALAICLAAFAPIVSAQSAQPGPRPGAVKDFTRPMFTSPVLVRPFATYKWAANWLAAKPAVRTSGAQGLGFRPFVRPLISDDDWNGAAGNWNATTWSLGSPPTSGNNAVITNSGGQVQLNVSDTINNLTIGSGNLLNFVNNNSLTINGTTITNSNSTGSGGITMSAGGNDTNLIIGANVTLTGGGTVTLGNSVNNRIYGALGTDILTNANNTIQGSGQIGADQMGLVNQGTIDANQATALTVWTSNGTTNTGTLEATAGGNLILQNDAFTNAGGTILASGSGSVATISE